MEYNSERATELLVRVLVVCAFVVAVVEPAAASQKLSAGNGSGDLYAVKRLSLRSRDPLTRRSPDTHFLRFGRTDGVRDLAAAAAAASTSATASKANVKREAFDLVDDTSKSRPASTRFVLRYNPTDVGRRPFFIATRRDNGAAAADRPDDVYHPAEPVDEYFANETIGRVVADSRLAADDAAAKLRYGRSAASDTFDRLIRRRENFTRLGRALNRDEGEERRDEDEGDVKEKTEGNDDDDDENGSGGNGDGDDNLEEAIAGKGEYGDRTSESDYSTSASFASANDDAKRRSASFIRFGRRSRRSSSPPPPPLTLPLIERDYAYDVVDAPSGKVDDENAFERFARRRDNFMRLGRDVDNDARKLVDDDAAAAAAAARIPRRSGSFMRLGRGNGERSSFERDVRRHGDNFMRLGRASAYDRYDNSDMFRETRRRDSFLRLGRATRYGGPRFVRDLPTADIFRSTANNDDDDDDDGDARHFSDNRTRNAAAESLASGDSNDDRSHPCDSTAFVECLRRYSHLPNASSANAVSGPTIARFGPATATHAVRHRADVAGEFSKNYRPSYRTHKSDENVYRIATTSV